MTRDEMTVDKMMVNKMIWWNDSRQYYCSPNNWRTNYYRQNDSSKMTLKWPYQRSCRQNVCRQNDSRHNEYRLNKYTENNSRLNDYSLHKST